MHISFDINSWIHYITYRYVCRFRIINTYKIYLHEIQEWTDSGNCWSSLMGCYNFWREVTTAYCIDPSVCPYFRFNSFLIAPSELLIFQDYDLGVFKVLIFATKHLQTTPKPPAKSQHPYFLQEWTVRLSCSYRSSGLKLRLTSDALLKIPRTLLHKCEHPWPY